MLQPSNQVLAKQQRCILCAFYFHFETHAYIANTFILICSQDTVITSPVVAYEFDLFLDYAEAMKDSVPHDKILNLFHVVNGKQAL